MRTGPWTKEDEGYLRWAYSQGLSVERASKHLGRTVDATKQKASRLGLQHPASAEPQARQEISPGVSPTSRASPLRPEEKPEPLRDESLRRFVHDPEALFAWLGVSLFPCQVEGLGLIQARSRSARSAAGSAPSSAA